MSKIVKTYESFIEDKNFKFEESVIDPILTCIRDNHDFLTRKENLPQLAKLGYMYNTLWYSGRICWGYDGILRSKKLMVKDEDGEYQYGDCEDNPKYKIEMTDPTGNGDVDDLVYDAWSLHVSRGEGEDGPNSKEFYDLIKNGKPLTELEKKELKVNKTLDDWVEIKTDPNYKYRSLYPDRKSVADYLLCVIGTGYGWNKDGFIIEEAGGADQDSALYGDWQNAKFAPQIQKVVDLVLSVPQLARTIDGEYNYIKKLKLDKENKKKDEARNRLKSALAAAAPDKNDEESEKLIDEILNGMYNDDFSSLSDDDDDFNVRGENYGQYYPISSSSKIYAMLSDEKKNREGIKKFDESYVKAAIEICQDIITHEKKEREDNVEFARKFLSKHGFKEYDNLIPKEIDKYTLLTDIEDCFLYITDRLQKCQSHVRPEKGEYNLSLNDTKDNDYADNNYNFSMSLEGYGLPNGYSNHIDFLKNTDIYKDINHTLHRLNQIKEIKNILLYCNNSNQQYDPSLLVIKIIVNDKNNHTEDIKYNDEYLDKLGFEVGSSMIAFKLKKYIFITQKPQPLGRKHPNNTSGKDYYGINKQLTLLDINWKKICNFQFDERNFNIMSADGTTHRDMVIKIIKELLGEHKKMKLSDPGYGTYGMNEKDRKGEGKKCLYAHDYIIWLKEHGF